MQLCTHCLHAEDRVVEHCPNCGGSDFARLAKSGSVIALPVAAGGPCQRCFEGGHGLKFRYYRWVLALLFFDRIHITAGYFCSSCRLKLFAQNLALTLVAGWWGVFALLFRNPFAIVTNIWALFAPPLGPSEHGALDINELRAGAIDSVLTEKDLYAVLAVPAAASPDEIKRSWRAQVKRHHPDVAGADRQNRIVDVNEAYRVLSDARLRHAYDHRHELAAWLGKAADFETEFGDADVENAEHDVELNWGCRLCQLGFTDYDAALEHIEQAHPGASLYETLVELDDGVESDERTIYVCKPCGREFALQHEIAEHLEDAHGDLAHLDGSDLVDFRVVPQAGSAPAAGWRCKSCDQVFDDYDDAVSHADAAHPNRTVVDVGTAVEPI